MTREQLEQKMSNLRGARVLLVEDNAFNQQVLSEMLEAFGFIVDIAQNGQQALDQLDKQSYHVVLMDLQMPVMDGFSATEKIRLNPAFNSLPVIALTANISQSDKDRCTEVGMNDHLGKPIEPEQLFVTLLRHVKAVTADAVQTPSPVAATSELPDLPGINPGPVLKRMKGNVATYLRMHGLFCQHFYNAADLMQQALGTGDVDSVRRLAHTLKGSAATIGAEQLSEVASRLEQECQLSCPVDAVLMNEFASALKIVIAGQIIKE